MLCIALSSCTCRFGRRQIFASGTYCIQPQTATDRCVVSLQGGGRFKFKSKSGSNGSTKRFKRFPRGRGAGCEMWMHPLFCTEHSSIWLSTGS